METLKWIAGIALGVGTLVTTWVLAHRNTHKDIYNKIDMKANKDYVDTEIKKITENLNVRLDSHVHESNAVNELLLNAMDKQGDLIKSMDGKLNILIQKMK